MSNPSALKSEKKIKYNSFAVVFIIFLYSLATLPGHFFNQGLIIIAMSIVVILPDVLWNFREHFNYRIIFALLFEVFLLLVLLIQQVKYPNYSEQINETIINLLSIGTIGILVGSFLFKEEYCLRYGLVLAKICFVTSLLYLFLSRGAMLASMRFGYAMLPSALFFLIDFYRNKSTISLFLLLLSVTSLVIWGSRGTLLVILVFFMLLFLKKQKGWLFIIVLLLAIFYQPLVDLTIHLLTTLGQMTGSNKIKGLIGLFSGEGWEVSAGRDVIYSHCIDLFREHPWGNGVGFWYYDTAMFGLYPHNIFLQVMTELGVIGLLVLCFILAVIVIKLFRTKNDRFIFLSFIFSIVIGRLTVSSIFWARPEFWLMLGIFLFNNKLSNQRLVF